MPRSEAFSKSCSLGQHPSAGLRELFYLSAPIMLILFANSIMGFCDRLFLAHYSLASLEGCVCASYLAQLCQISLCFCTSSAQVFVGRCMGAKKYSYSGIYIWQMIWFSFASIIVLCTLGYIADYLFFNDTVVKGEGSLYFRTLLPFIFLFPLGSAIASFYFGRGKIGRVVFATILANVLNALLDPLLIWGVDGWFAGLGTEGAALATGLSQLFFCVVIFFNFINKENREFYGTGKYRLQWNFFKESLRIGLPRCLSKMTIYAAWIANVRLMTLKEGDFLLVLPLWSALILLFNYWNDGVLQGVITSASYLIGKGDLLKIKKLLNTAFILLAIASVVVFVPCVLFPKYILSSFYIDLQVDDNSILIRSCQWFWVYFIVYGLSNISAGLLTAYGFTPFKMFYDLFSTWLLNYLPIAIALEMYNCSVDVFFFINNLSILITVCIYFSRLYFAKKLPGKMLNIHLNEPANEGP